MQKDRETIRVFFALWPDAAERAALAAWQTPLQQRVGGSAMRADTLHTTLVFLGDLAARQLQTLELAAREVGGQSFVLCFDTARYWGHNRILFAAPTHPPQALFRLVADLEQRLAGHRFRFDRRPYKPHVTLLRHARWHDADLPPMPAVRWTVSGFVLVQSLRDERGARYEVLARFPLG